ncbi:MULTISPECIES: hypothetical protein [unclassified Myroides]|uniref:hypothetical protein n=1 Tax=unclassified Myroides TaxID=2642485 RepID=UPI003D2F5AD6
MKKIYYVILMGVACGFSSFSQVKDPSFTKEEFLEDFDILVELVKKQHPNPFRSISEAAFDQQVAANRNKLKQNPSFENFVLYSPFGLLADTHLSLSTDPVFYESYVKTIHHFPLETLVYDNRVFVNQYTVNLPLGVELISVNGQRVADLLKRIPKAADGFIEVNSQKDFTVYLPFLLPGATSYDLVYKEVNSTVLKSSKLKGVPYVTYD